MSAEQLRAIGGETIAMFQEPAPAGRRALATTPYLEGWAKRYWRSQQKVERSRLREGKARHRAHREPIKTKPAEL